MTLIEGFGDEVTIFIGVVALLLIMLLAWASTHTTDIPFFRLVIVNLMNRNATYVPEQHVNNVETFEYTYDMHEVAGESVQNTNLIREVDILGDHTPLNDHVTSINFMSQEEAGSLIDRMQEDSVPVDGVSLYESKHAKNESSQSQDELACNDDTRQTGHQSHRDESTDDDGQGIVDIKLRGDTAACHDQANEWLSVGSSSKTASTLRATTASTSQATTASTSQATTASTSQATTASTSQATTASTSQATTASTSQATTASTSQATATSTSRATNVLGGAKTSINDGMQETTLRQRRLAYFDRKRDAYPMDTSSLNRETDSCEIFSNFSAKTVSGGSDPLPCHSQTTTETQSTIAAVETEDNGGDEVRNENGVKRRERVCGNGTRDFSVADGLNKNAKERTINGLDDSGCWNTEGDADDGEGAGGRERRSFEDEGVLDGRMKVRLVYLNDTHREVVADPVQTIAEFRQAHFAEEIADNKLVRFIYNGNVLRNDSSTLQSYNIRHNSAVHCLVTQISTQNSTHQHANALYNEDTPFDMSGLMFPLFAVLLAFVWYLRFSYRRYFNAMSTFSLVVITLLFITSYLAPALFDSYTRRRPIPPHPPSSNPISN